MLTAQTTPQAAALTVISMVELLAARHHTPSAASSSATVLTPLEHTRNVVSGLTPAFIDNATNLVNPALVTPNAVQPLPLDTLAVASAVYLSILTVRSASTDVKAVEEAAQASGDMIQLLRPLCDRLGVPGAPPGSHGSDL